jgi:serine/threonine-protein kinase
VQESGEDMTGGASLVGRILDGRYRIVAPLGEGGMGVVFRAEDLRLDRPVALKVLQQEYVDNDQLKERFNREYRALASLSHPNIVSITDHGIFDQTPYLVMALLEGETLHQRLRRGALPPGRAVAIARQMLRALAHAHRQGMVHRDLKPGNIFVRPMPDDSDHVTILDFGLVRFVAGEQDPHGHQQQLTRAGSMLGTPAYMAPEQAAGETTDPRTDVYAAGVVLFEMLAGQKPFAGDPSEVLRHHMLSPVPRLAERAPELLETEAMDALLARALSKSRQLRFADAGELLEALEGVTLPVVSPDASRAAPPTELATMPTLHAGELAASGAGRPPEATKATVVSPISPVARGRAPAPATASPTPKIAAPSASPRARLFAGAGLAAALLALLFLAVVGGADDPPPAESATARADEASPADPARPPAPGADARPARAATEAPPATPTAPVNTVSPSRPPPADPWASGVPRALSRAKRAVDSGREVSTRLDRGLLRHARENPTDARADLLLAGAFISRGWRSDGVERYELAYNRDASSRGDPRMLRDLVALAADSAAGAKASRAVRRIYGREALAEIDRQLGAGGLGRDERARLLRLRQAIEEG